MAIPNFYQPIQYPIIQQTTPNETFFSQIAPYEKVIDNQQRRAMNEAELGLKAQQVANNIAAVKQAQTQAQSRLGMEQAKFNRVQEREAAYKAAGDAGGTPAQILSRIQMVAADFGDIDAVSMLGSYLGKLYDTQASAGDDQGAAETLAAIRNSAVNPAIMQGLAAARKQKNTVISNGMIYTPNKQGIYGVTITEPKRAEIESEIAKAAALEARAQNRDTLYKERTAALAGAKEAASLDAATKQTQRQIQELEKELRHLDTRVVSRFIRGTDTQDPDYPAKVRVLNAAKLDLKTQIANLKGEPPVKPPSKIEQLLDVMQAIREGGKEGIR